ncbi:uncharacterized protein F5Z01DRAFT_639076 [Emericellopsis atlantica]|uniref:Uncharacterized protein n=1 Tax=Emericellopsis atlantica TaxID=2614577 RepID=A0A9P8CM84_9HYPO|nr:uncharacterized protein F5Z01DRAFT_639076 [Emericellopsis atlantica]KAG9251775.1 hypothetical protein F5Z01DRAFT_639076 [Emericellopsis atlantica]
MASYTHALVDTSTSVDESQNGMLTLGDPYMGDDSANNPDYLGLPNQEGFMVDPRVVAYSNFLYQEAVQAGDFIEQPQFVAQQPGSMLSEAHEICLLSLFLFCSILFLHTPYCVLPYENLFTDFFQSFMPMPEPAQISVMASIPEPAQTSVMAPIPISLPLPQTTEQPQHHSFTNTGLSHHEPSPPALLVSAGQGQYRAATDAELVENYLQFKKHRQGPSAANAAQSITTTPVPEAAPKPPTLSDVPDHFVKAYEQLIKDNVFVEDGCVCVSFEGDTVHFVKNLKDIKVMGFLAFPVSPEKRQELESQGVQANHKSMYDLMVYNESSPIPAGEILHVQQS